MAGINLGANAVGGLMLGDRAVDSVYLGAEKVWPSVPPPSVPEYSLGLNGTSQYLSMSNADWGSYDRDKFSIAGSILTPSGTTGTRVLFQKNDEVGVSFFWSGTDWKITVYLGGGINGSYQLDGHFYNGSFYSFLLDFDLGNPVGTDRMRIYTGNVRRAPTVTQPFSAITPNNQSVNIGYDPTNTIAWDSWFRGDVYSLGFFSGSNPDPSDIFDGTAGKVKSFTGLTGLYSYLTCEGGEPRFDAVKGPTAWINNNAATASSTIP